MLSPFIAVALVAAATGASPGAPPPGRRGPVRADLAVHVRPIAGDAALGAADGPRGGAQGAPPCLGEVCQPRVSVPGFDPAYQRPSRTELALSYLDRVRLEPFATIAWALLVTGLRLDWSPPVSDGASPGGWGSVFVRVKLRVDADNKPVVPRRPRDQGAVPRRDS